MATPRQLQLGHPRTEPFPHYGFGAPQQWRGHIRGSDEARDDLEHLTHESLGRPVRHGNGSARNTQPHEFAGDTVWPRCEHGADEADDDIKTGVRKWHLLGIRYLEP